MRGFTVFETLISMLIFAVITASLGMALVAGKNSLFTSDVPTQLRQNMIFSIISLSRELRKTTPSKTNLSSGTSSNSITFQVPFDNNSDGTIVDTIGSIEWSGDITYAVNGFGQLIRTQSGVTKIISPNINTLVFSRPAGMDKIMQIDIAVAKTNTTGTWQDQEQVRLKMRN